MYDEAHIRDWIRKLAVLRPELGGFAVCPYASGASFTIIECPVNDIKPMEGFDVVIFVIERELEPEDVEDWWALESHEENSLLSLDSNILWPFDVSGEVSGWLDISTNSEVSRSFLEERSASARLRSSS